MEKNPPQEGSGVPSQKLLGRLLDVDQPNLNVIDGSSRDVGPQALNHRSVMAWAGLMTLEGVILFHWHLKSNLVKG
jgi:hypothetical protein